MFLKSYDTAHILAHLYRNGHLFEAQFTNSGKKKERERAVRRPGTMLTAYGVLLNPLTPTPAPPPTH